MKKCVAALIMAVLVCSSCFADEFRKIDMVLYLVDLIQTYQREMQYRQYQYLLDEEEDDTEEAEENTIDEPVVVTRNPKVPSKSPFTFHTPKIPGLYPDSDKPFFSSGVSAGVGLQDDGNLMTTATLYALQTQPILYTRLNGIQLQSCLLNKGIAFDSAYVGLGFGAALEFPQPSFSISFNLNFGFGIVTPFTRDASPFDASFTQMKLQLEFPEPTHTWFISLGYNALLLETPEKCSDNEIVYATPLTGGTCVGFGISF